MFLYHFSCFIAYYFAAFVEVDYFDDRNAFSAVLAIFLCACAKLTLFVLPVQNLLSLLFSATSISNKSTEILAI